MVTKPQLSSSALVRSQDALNTSSEPAPFEGVRSVQPSASMPNLHLGLSSTDLGAGNVQTKFSLDELMQKARQYCNESDDKAKTQLYQDIMRNGAKAKTDPSVDIADKRTMTRALYELSRVEAARLADKLAIPRLEIPSRLHTQRLEIMSQTLFEFDSMQASAALLSETSLHGISKIRQPELKLDAIELERLLDSTEANALGIKSLQLRDAGGAQHTHFYCDGVFVGELTPKDEEFNAPSSSSAEKYVKAKNASTVFLKQRMPFKFKTAESQLLTARKNHLFSQISAKLNATALNYMLDKDGSIMTENAGKDLHAYLFEENATLDCSAFELVAKDLKTLHQHGIHHLDLKPENFAFADKTVKLIDTDAMSLLPDSAQLKDSTELKIINQASYPAFTSAYLPAPFQSRLSDRYHSTTNLASLAKIRSAADNFSFLLTLIESTEGSFFSNEYDQASARELPRGNGLREEKVSYLTENEQGEMIVEQETMSEMELAHQWAKVHVKDEHRANFLSFVRDPLRYINNKHNPEFSVLDIIDWQK